MKALMLIVAAIIAPISNAALITFDVIEAGFYNPQGGNVTLLEPTPTATATTTQVRWGTQTTRDNALTLDSGYDFIARPTSFTETVGDSFELGVFSHLNNPIQSGSAVDSVNLRLKADFSLDLGGGQTFDYFGEEFLFTFVHDETPNGDDPCLYDETDGLAVSSPANTPVNDNGCADLVTVNSLSSTFVDPIAGLTLNIDGFSASLLDAQNSIYETAFVSGEGSINTVILTANFDVPPPRIPAPAMFALMALGAISSFSLARKRKHQV